MGRAQKKIEKTYSNPHKIVQHLLHFVRLSSFQHLCFDFSLFSINILNERLNNRYIYIFFIIYNSLYLINHPLITYLVLRTSNNLQLENELNPNHPLITYLVFRFI